MVDERTRKVIDHGRRIRAVLAQPQFAPLALGEQVALLLALTEGLLNSVPLDRVEAFRSKLGPWTRSIARRSCFSMTRWPHCPPGCMRASQTRSASWHARSRKAPDRGHDCGSPKYRPISAA